MRSNKTIDKSNKMRTCCNETNEKVLIFYLNTIENIFPERARSTDHIIFKIAEVVLSTNMDTNQKKNKSNQPINKSITIPINLRTRFTHRGECQQL